MNSPRKTASSSSSPRGTSVASTKTQNSPRTDKLDSSQLTPRRRQKIDTHSARDHLQGLLPNKIASLPLAPTTPMPSRPKAAPRVIIEEMVEEVDQHQHVKKRDSLSVPSGGRYGDRGSGDAILRLPLEGMSKLEIKGELKHGKVPLTFGYDLDKEEGDEVEEAEETENLDGDIISLEPDRARFNVWKGKNYELHLLGEFKSDFEKRVKSFQRPDTEPIVLDPFCRSESGLIDEPPNSDAFLIWKSKPNLKWRNVKEKEPALSSPFPVSSGDDEEVDIDDDEDSLPDPEMKEYILAQQQSREEGLNMSGETLYYDEDFEMVRNLHRDSYSLTNYGVMPDDKWIGKAHVFYPEMTEAEKKMLRVPEKKKPSLSPRIAVVRRNNK